MSIFGLPLRTVPRSPFIRLASESPLALQPPRKIGSDSFQRSKQ